MISALFDDHYMAFPLWREAGLKGLTCVHVDAHLDVSSDGFDAASLEVPSGTAPTGVPVPDSHDS